jgi:Jacalin-like lectin domain
MRHSTPVRHILSICAATAILSVGPTMSTAYAQLPPYIAGQQGPSGGWSGDRCAASDVPADWQISSINVHSHDVIESIDLTYNAPGAPEPPAPIHCGGGGGTANRLLTLDPGEYIVRVLGRSYSISLAEQSPLICYLYIQTSLGKMREYGDTKCKSGNWFDYQAPEGTAITGFIIYSHTYVDRFGVVLQKRP